ncbi:MAG: hypothetical protein K8H84_10980 [Sulfuricella denitrificans]|nr:hypothetical protein [Sulfuricella denitrificans]
MTENLTPFFADFGVNATIGGGTVRGIHDAVFAETFGFTAGFKPVFICPASAVPNIAEGDAVIIAATTYKVAGVEPDGTGMTLLRLEAA